MMDKYQLIAKLLCGEDHNIKRSIYDVYNYQSVKPSFDLFFSATPVFSVESEKYGQWLEAFFLKHLVPDTYLQDLLSVSRAEREVSMGFYNVFLSTVIGLDSFIMVKNKQYMFTNSLKSLNETSDVISNRKNIEYSMRKFFSYPIKIVENISRKVVNEDPVTLGKTTLCSKLDMNRSKSIGRFLYTVADKYFVFVKVSENELEKLQEFYKITAGRQLFIIRSRKNYLSNRVYNYRLSYVGNKLKSIDLVT